MLDLQHLVKASALQTAEPLLTSGCQALDQLTGDGFPAGLIVEWGMPEGRQGRELILAYIKRQIYGDCLWVCPESSLHQIYPPAWQARGIDLNRVRFARCEDIVSDLRPVFFEDTFSFIVLDQPKNFTKDDLAFLALRVRQQTQTIFVLRPYFLHSNLGNVWARYRLNCFWDQRARKFHVSLLRGQQMKTILCEVGP